MTEQPAPKPPKRRRKKSDIARIVVISVFFLLAAWALQSPTVRANLFDIQTIRDHLQSLGIWSSIVFIGVSAIAMGVGLPRLWVATVAGTVWGALEGSLIAQSAAIIGATLNFLSARSLLRGPIMRMLPSWAMKRMEPWIARFSENGFRWILYIRLFPFSNATVTNVACGMSRVRYRDFLAATFLGYLPFTVAFAILGSSAAKASTLQFALGIGLFAAVAGGRYVYLRLRGPEAETEVEPEEEGDSPAAPAPESVPKR